VDDIAPCVKNPNLILNTYFNILYPGTRVLYSSATVLYVRYYDDTVCVLFYDLKNTP
jgi:hypothetical protein